MLGVQVTQETYGQAPSKGRSPRSCLALPPTIRCTTSLVGSARHGFTRRSAIWWPA